MNLVTLDRERPLRHPWLTTPDELEHDLAADRPPRDVYRWAIQHGWTDAQAGTLVAYVAHVPLVDGEGPLRAWRLREVQHLEFLRAIVSAGRLRGDTEAAE